MKVPVCSSVLVRRAVEEARESEEEKEGRKRKKKNDV